MEGISGTSMSDPTYTAVIGTLLLAGKYGTAKKPFKINFSFGNSFNSLKNIFKKLIP